MISLDEKISTVNFFTHKMYSNDFVMNENFSYTEVAVLTFKYFNYPRTCFDSKITVYVLISKISFIN